MVVGMPYLLLPRLLLIPAWRIDHENHYDRCNCFVEYEPSFDLSMTFGLVVILIVDPEFLDSWKYFYFHHYVLNELLVQPVVMIDNHLLNMTIGGSIGQGMVSWMSKFGKMSDRVTTHRKSFDID